VTLNIGGISLETNHKVNLTAAEKMNLWTTYMTDSMTICMLKHFIKNVDDEEIRPLIQYALHLSNQHVQKVSDIFREEKLAVPLGFTEEDVNENAPRLYPDAYYLLYLHKQSNLGLNANGVALSTSIRANIRKFYSELIASTVELHNRTMDVILNKGIAVRPPFIGGPDKVEFVEKQNFLTGWFGNRRPLTAIEATHLFYHILRNTFGSSLLTGFAQVTDNQEVKNMMDRGRKIASKIVETCGSILSESELPAPSTWDAQPTNSTVAPWSDKLMMYHTSVLTGAGIGFYGTSLGTAVRRDLGGYYTRIMAEAAQYGEDLANIMIDNSWMEKPPQAPNRRALINNKK
jgi:hypothetical protein